MSITSDDPRELTQVENDLITEIKELREKTGNLIDRIMAHRSIQAGEVKESEGDENGNLSVRVIEESMRCLSLAKGNIQQGHMWLVRSIYVPDSF